MFFATIFVDQDAFPQIFAFWNKYFKNNDVIAKLVL